jgi:hypothetical protein
MGPRPVSYAGVPRLHGTITTSLSGGCLLGQPFLTSSLWLVLGNKHKAACNMPDSVRVGLLIDWTLRIKSRLYV